MKKKNEKYVVMCYVITILIIGIVGLILLFPTMSFIALFFVGIFWFAFLGIPLMDIEGRYQAQKSKQDADKRKNAYKRARRWE